MIAIVFFCFRPPKELFDFAKLLKGDTYDIFVAINDNDYIIPEYDTNVINIIRLNEREVKNAGYFNSNWNIRGNVSSRDKAFYYFNKINHTNYDHIWFIEEDVFIPTTKTIMNIDEKYPDGDYMSNCFVMYGDNINTINKFNNINPDIPFVEYNDNYDFFESTFFKENNVKEYFDFVWLKGMTAAIRVSKKFLNEIDAFAFKHKTLFMDEILYPTISLHTNLLIINPVELSTIVYRRDYCLTDKISKMFYWNINDVRDDYLFHPFKELRLQDKLRLRLDYYN
jgi:hypothetical protein